MRYRVSPPQAMWPLQIHKHHDYRCQSGKNTAINASIFHNNMAGYFPDRRCTLEQWSGYGTTQVFSEDTLAPHWGSWPLSMSCLHLGNSSKLANYRFLNNPVWICNDSSQPTKSDLLNNQNLPAVTSPLSWEQAGPNSEVGVASARPPASSSFSSFFSPSNIISNFK